MSNLTIVPFNTGYFEQALEVLHESNCLHAKENPEHFSCDNKEASRPYLQSIIDNPKTFGLIALSQGEVAGLLLAGLKIRDENVYKHQKYYKIFDLAVNNKYKKMGIGRRLNQKLCELAQNNDIKQIELEVFSFNKGAIAFYEKLDYVEISKIMSLKV